MVSMDLSIQRIKKNKLIILDINDEYKPMILIESWKIQLHTQRIILYVPNKRRRNKKRRSL